MNKQPTDTLLTTNFGTTANKSTSFPSTTPNQSGISPVVIVGIVFFIFFVLGGGYWYTNVYNKTPEPTQPVYDTAQAAAGAPAVVPVVVPPAGAVIPKCKVTEELVNGKCLIICADGTERIGEQCLIKCADGQLRDGVACKDDPKALGEMQNKLDAAAVMNTHGTSVGGAAFNFTCDKTLGDYIKTISGNYDNTGPRKLTFICNSGRTSDTYGNYNNPNATKFDLDIKYPYNSIKVKSSNYIDSIGGYGNSGGTEKIDACPTSGEMIRGVTGLFDTSFDQIGFKCA